MNSTKTEVYMWTAINPDGEEGICAGCVDDIWYPLVTITPDVNGPKMENMAKVVALKSGMNITLKRYTLVEEIKTITPEDA